MDVAGVPESVPREAVLLAVESLGLDWRQLRSLSIGSTCITAEVYALASDGKRFINERRDGEVGAAVHQLAIRIED